MIALLPVWNFLKSLPWWIYALVAAVLYHVAAIHIAASRATDECNAKWEVKVAQQQKAQDAANALANAKLSDARYAVQQSEAALDLRLANESQETQAKVVQAKEKEVEYVPVVVAPDMLPVGYILWRIDSAGFANGIDFPPAPAAPRESLGDPSGISLTQITDLDLAQAASFRDAVTWGSGWKDRAIDLEKLYTQVTATKCAAVVSP